MLSIVFIHEDNRKNNLILNALSATKLHITNVPDFVLVKDALNNKKYDVVLIKLTKKKFISNTLQLINKNNANAIIIACTFPEHVELYKEYYAITLNYEIIPSDLYKEIMQNTNELSKFEEPSWSNRKNATVNDQDVWAQLQIGDSSGLQQVYTQYYEMFLVHAQILLVDRYRARKALEECVAFLYKNAKQYQPNGKILFFLFRQIHIHCSRVAGKKCNAEGLISYQPGGNNTKG